MNSATKEQFTYDADAKVSTKNSAILGRLEGPCADIVDATRNGRKYSDKLWENVFKNPIVKEYFECGGVFGELGHPTDREETDMSKIAICMPEPPTKGSDNLLHGSWDILDTPNGRILKCLCDYGYRIGISSRGSGDLEMDFNGDESVNPDTYNFQAFDAVLLPAVKKARLNYVSESLDTSKKSLSVALSESLNSANADEKKIMMETLDNLKISYNVDLTEDVDSNAGDAGNAGDDVIKDLQVALKTNKLLEKQVKHLQEELSVRYTEEAALRDKCGKQQASIQSLSRESKRVKVIESRVKALEESLREKNAEIRHYSRKNAALNEQINSLKATNTKLVESLQEKESVIGEIGKQKQSLREQVSNAKRESDAKNQSLLESISNLKHDLQVTKAEYSKKLDESVKTAERYRTVAKVAVDRYIGVQAAKLGVKPSDIKSKLTENFSFDDIDRVCESLTTQMVNVSKLPFSANKSSKVSVKVTESKESIKPTNRCVDDDVDDQLLSLANLK